MIVLPVLLALGFSVALNLGAQDFTLNWFTVDGGGGQSTGGVFTVTGTIGQPDAGMMTGGTYTLNGGFWGIIAAVQTEGAPLLSIALNPQLSTITVSWPLPATGWLLNATTNLVTGGSVWTEIPPAYQTNGVNLQFTEPLPVGNKFYRLHKP